MPSLEIICIGQTEPLEFEGLPFEVRAEIELRSHRRPSLFQSDFDRLEGCIYHLLEPGGITVYDLLIRDWSTPEGEPNGLDDNVEFEEEFTGIVKDLLSKLLAASPAGQLLFTTDYQFGPKPAARFGPVSLEEFWQLHQEGRVRMNAAYLIRTAPYPLSSPIFGFSIEQHSHCAEDRQWSCTICRNLASNMREDEN